MKKLYDKNELTFAIVCIVIYCVLQSLANPLNQMIGVDYSASAAFCIIQTVILFTFIRKNNFMKQYGLCKSAVAASRFLFYIPLVILASGNLWNGFAVNYSLPETICRIVCMMCVGFLEEVIFRGFLFVSIAKNNTKSAIIISSVTFGVGHLINLFNGSGMDLISNLCQICFAIAVGFLLVTIFYRGGSLIPCIVVHSAINTLSTFANEVDSTMEGDLIHIAIMILITVVYTVILTKTLPKKTESNGRERTMRIISKIIAILLGLVIIITAVFLAGRYGWKLLGFDVCQGAGIERVSVNENSVNIKGFYPGSFPQGFCGYYANEQNGTLYVGFRFSSVCGFFGNGDFDITIPVKGEVKEVVLKTKLQETIIWTNESMGTQGENH